MTDATTNFRALHERPGAFVIPNPWSIGSAKLMASLGFEALATTSSGHAYSLGRPDGLKAVSREEALRHAAQLVAATPLPVSADLEGGYGNDPETVAETVRAAGAIGLAGCSIEDATGDPADPIHDRALARARIDAAVEAARSLPSDFILTARAENYIHGRPNFADTVERLQSFQEAGADVLYAPGISDLAEMRRLVGEVNLPVNALARPHWTVDELGDAGVKRISIGGAMAVAAYGTVLKASREILSRGSFTYMTDRPPDLDLDELFQDQ